MERRLLELLSDDPDLFRFSECEELLLPLRGKRTGGSNFALRDSEDHIKECTEAGRYSSIRALRHLVNIVPSHFVYWEEA